MAQADYVMSVMVKPMDCDSAMLKKLRKEMKKQMRLRYLNKIHDIHWKCTLLCPAYRNKTFLKRQYFMDKGTRVYFIASKRADVIASIKEDIVLIKKYDTYLEAQQRLNRSTSESDFVMDDPDAPEEQTRTNFCDLLGYSDDEEDEEDVQGQDEVDTYLALNISSHDRSLSKDNPLAWWSNADSRFGLVYLKRLTAWLYSIKGSSCPSEGMFSEYGNIVSAKTARLGEKKAEDTLFLHQQRKKKHEKR
eukprot:66005_1